MEERGEVMRRCNRGMLALRRRPNRGWLAACEMSIRGRTMKRDEALKMPRMISVAPCTRSFLVYTRCTIGAAVRHRRFLSGSTSENSQEPFRILMLQFNFHDARYCTDVQKIRVTDKGFDQIYIEGKFQVVQRIYK